MEPESPATETASEGCGVVDRERFRRAMGRFAGGVTIITARHAGRDYGLTASAVSLLSLDPPMLLICVNQASHTRDAIVASGAFGVNILREQHGELARQFAAPHHNKFAGLNVSYGPHGVPLLEGMLATIECRVGEMVSGGTHTVFLAEASAASLAEGMPLIAFRGRLGRLTDAYSANTTPHWEEMYWEDIA